MTARAGDVEIACETFGARAGDPLLLVMGVGAQMIYWHDEFCATLAARRFLGSAPRGRWLALPYVSDVSTVH